MKIASTLKSLKKRDLNSKLVKRRGKLYVINKKNPRFKMGIAKGSEEHILDTCEAITYVMKISEEEGFKKYYFSETATRQFISKNLKRKQIMELKWLPVKNTMMRI